MDPNTQPVIAPKNKMSGRTKAALWCLIAPTALYIVIFFMYAIVNFFLAGSGVGSGGSNDENLFSTTPLFVTVLNSIMFLAGIIAFITWLPGIIVGIILLATKKPAAPQI